VGYVDYSHYYFFFRNRIALGSAIFLIGCALIFPLKINAQTAITCNPEYTYEVYDSLPYIMYTSSTYFLTGNMQGQNMEGDRMGRIFLVEGDTWHVNNVRGQSSCFPLVEYETNTCTLVSTGLVPTTVNTSSTTYSLWFRTSINSCASYGTQQIPLIQFPAFGDPVGTWETAIFQGESLTFSTSTDPWDWLAGQTEGEALTPSEKMRKWVADQIFALRYNPPQGFFFRAYDLFNGVFTDINTDENAKIEVTVLGQSIPVMSTSTFGNANIDMSEYRTYSTAIIYFMFGLWLISIIKIPT